MEYKLLMVFKDELYDEAKRLVPICYDQKDLLNCSFEKLHNNLNKKYEKFEVTFHLILTGLCILKNEGKDYLNEKVNYKELIDHHLRVINGKKEKDNEDLYEATKIISEDIIKNREKYKKESLYTLIPKLSKKYITFHNDSFDWECIVMLLEQNLKEQGFNLESTNLSDLKKI